jgi:hypothetical protein
LPFIDPLSTTQYPIQKLPPLSAGAPLADLPHKNPYSTRSALACSASANLSQVHLKRERRPSDGGPQPPTSQSNSLSISHSSYSRFSNTPPAPHATLATAQPSSFFHPHTEASPDSSMPRSNASYGPVSTAAGQKYQLMTLDTNQGPIQVPIDVQVASKVADEKRKRNATASHRFRRRRKEKDREEPCRTGGLVPGMREINGAVLGRLPYYLVWQLPSALPSFLPFLIAFGSFDYRAYYCLFAVVFTALQLFLSTSYCRCNCFAFTAPVNRRNSSSWHLVKAKPPALPPLISHLMLAALLVLGSLPLRRS